MREEILTLSNKDTSIKVAGNSISAITNKNIEKKGARVFKDKKIHSASFVGSIDNSEILKRASENKEGAIDFNYSLPTLSSLSQKDTLELKTEEDLLSTATNIMDYFRTNHPHFIFSGPITLSKVKKELEVVGEGKLEHEIDMFKFFFNYKHKDSEGISDGMFVKYSASDFSISDTMKDYSRFLNVFENEVTLKSKKMPVVFVDPSMLFYKMCESVRADFYKKDLGLFKGQLGKKVLDEKFSLMDVSYDPKLFALDLFDGDGFVRENPEFDIIKDGVFENLVCDSRNAHKYGLKPTGNSKRNFDTSSSQLEFNNVQVKKGKRTSEEILSDLPECIIVDNAMGGAFTDTGDYSTPVQNGFLVQNGKITGRIPQITLTSSVEKMFGRHLIEVASNPISQMQIENNPAIFTEMDVLVN